MRICVGDADKKNEIDRSWMEEIIGGSSLSTDRMLARCQEVGQLRASKQGGNIRDWEDVILQPVEEGR